MATYHGHGSTVMSVNDLTCEFHMPNARHSEFRQLGEAMEEIEQRLPEYALQMAYNVDEYPVALPEWKRGSTTEASYFVVAQANKGMWLDLNRNQEEHRYQVAVLISIQGVNPITGQPMEGIELKQYSDTCPEHNTPFEAQRFCRKCNFKWPKQNYLASNATPEGSFWLDGFRAGDGRVRQYVFTSEIMRGVAAQVIGDERVFAIGVSFFLSKAPKPVPVPNYHRDRLHYYEGLMKGGGHDTYEGLLSGDSMRSVEGERGAVRTRGGVLAAQRLEVAAGARISQHVYDDPENLDFWQDVPAGTIYINYTNANTRDYILATGKDDRNNYGEGPLGGLRVGNP